MARRKLIRFEDWEAEKIKEAAFIQAAEGLEPGYQVARLRILRGLTQAQLADLVGTRQPSIARLENGSSPPTITYLNKIADALNARLEIRLIAESDETGYLE